jgi:hypothetical protein
VNIGGLFVLEPFITPALFEKYPTAVDEWTLSQLMAADTANGGLAQLEDHYKTFIVGLMPSSYFDVMLSSLVRRSKISHKWQVPVSTGFAFLFRIGS